MRLALAALVLAACTSNVDLTGVYRVDTDVGSAPCGADTAIADGPPYLKFTKSSLLGTDYFAYDGCTDAAATMCTSVNGLFDGFSQPIDHGWQGVVESSSPNAGMCLLSYVVATATLSGTSLVIENHSYSDTVMLDAAMCTTDEAAKRNTALPCTTHERIEATKQ